MAPASASGSGPTRHPLRPLSISSAGPPASTASTGKPLACASRIVCPKVSVVLVDLDGFKEINDELGHAAGDETLRGMAEILLKHSRGINVICRYGGDEFAILLVETSKGGARLYADRIRYVLPGHRFSHGRRVSASFGIASLPEDVTPSPDALIRAADEALYAAKRAGKNRVSVYEKVRSSPPRGASSPDQG